MKLIDADASKEELVRLHIEVPPSVPGVCDLRHVSDPTLQEQRDLLQQRHKPWGSLSFGTSVEHLEGAQLVRELL